MVADDITEQFRSVLSKAQSSSSSLTSRSKSPFRARSPSRRSKGKSKEEEQDEAFLNEAYRIHAHLASLGTLLVSIKKPYLSTAPAPLRKHDRGRGNEIAPGQDEDGLEKWKESKYLTDRERDEIDLRGRIILRRCRERVLALEDAEKARQKAVNPPAASALYSFLPSLAPVDESSIFQPLIAAHRSSVIWSLNDMLAKLSGTLGDMQEERAKRRQERSRTLGGRASREAAVFGGPASGGTRSESATELGSGLGSGSGSGSVADLFKVKRGNGGPEVQGVIPQDEPPIEQQLSPAQLQQFASENNALLEHMESKLDTVLAAEKSLLEISAMQTELVRHLTQQTEITERLYDEAVGSVAEVGKANTQLRQARQRGEEGRLFLLIFLLGASFALLFLNWYK